MLIVAPAELGGRKANSHRLKSVTQELTQAVGMALQPSF